MASVLALTGFLLFQVLSSFAFFDAFIMFASVSLEESTL
jgi:hypothetical protein